MIDVITELLKTPIDSWTEALEEQLVAAIRSTLSTRAKILVYHPCDSASSAEYWATVAHRITANNADVVHQGGTKHDPANNRLFWNWSRWPAAISVGSIPPAAHVLDFEDHITYQKYHGMDRA